MSVIGKRRAETLSASRAIGIAYLPEYLAHVALVAGSCEVSLGLALLSTLHVAD
jgi:hypothetical protein